MTIQEAKIRRKFYSDKVEKLMKAQLALIEGGVKSYTIDDRSLTRFDLDVLSKEIEEAFKKIDELDTIINGGNRRKAVAVVPRDF